MKLLRAAGANSTFFGEDDDQVVVGFQAQGRRIKITIPVPDRENGPEVRRRWRCLLLSLKAKFEAINSEISTFEIEFQPYTVLPNGQTVAELVQPLISKAYASGKMPALSAIGE